MSKKGTAQPQRANSKSKNELHPMHEVQNAVKHGEEYAKTIVTETKGTVTAGKGSRTPKA